MADEHTRDLLRQGVGTLPSAPPHDEIVRRADRLRRQRRAARSSAATAVVVVVIAGVLGLAASVQRQPEIAVDDADRAAGGCEEPAYRPGYLPWLGVGADVPVPDAVSPTPSGTTLRWSEDAGADGATVTLTRRHGTVGAEDGRYIPGGGRLSHLGDRARVVWDLGGEQCNLLELAFTVPQRTMKGEDVRRAAVGVALSLATPDGRLFEAPEPAVCPPPPAMPTYLPWLPEGEPLTAPEVDYWQDAPDDDSYNLTWSASDAGGDSSDHVGLSRSSDGLGRGGGEPANPQTPTSDRVLVSADQGMAMTRWEIDGSACNIVTLTLAAGEGMSRERADQELRRIIDHLAPRPPEFGVLAD